MGIINHPQAAILQVESIVKKPVVINDMIAIRTWLIYVFQLIIVF